MDEQTSQSPAPSQPGDQRVQMICLMVITAVMIGAAMYWLRPVLLPFVLSLFFVCGLSPILEWIEGRLHVGRTVSVTVAFGLGAVLVIIVWSACWYSVIELESNLGDYQRRFEQLLDSVAEWIPDPEDSESIEPAVDVDSAAGSSEAETRVSDSRESVSKVTRIQDFLSLHFRNLLGELSLSLMGLLSTAATVLIFMFFLLLGNTRLQSSEHGIWNAVARRIRGYIVTKTVISVVTGIAFGGVLWMYDIPLSFLFGMLACLLNFIPNIGPILASLLPLPLIVLHPELGPVAKGFAIAISFAVQFVSGNVIEPMIMGDSFEMHPVAILLSLMFWGMIWGVAGMFLAVPVTVAISMVLEKFEVTRGVALFISGRLSEIRQPAEMKPSNA